MATITNVSSLSTHQLSGNNWKLSMTYDGNFSAQEVNQQFEYCDSFVVWEDDTLVAVAFRK